MHLRNLALLTITGLLASSIACSRTEPAKDEADTMSR